MLQKLSGTVSKNNWNKKISKAFRICLRLNLALIKKSATMQLSIQSSFFHQNFGSTWLLSTLGNSHWDVFLENSLFWILNI